MGSQGFGAAASRFRPLITRIRSSAAILCLPHRACQVAVLVQYIGDTLPLPGARETLDDLEGSPVVQRLMGTNGIVHFLPG